MGTGNSTCVSRREGGGEEDWRRRRGGWAKKKVIIFSKLLSNRADSFVSDWYWKIRVEESYKVW